MELYNIVLTRDAKKLLKQLKNNPNTNLSSFTKEVFEDLEYFGFVESTIDYTNNFYDPDIKVIITPAGRNYLKYRTKEFIYHATPIIISIIALLKSFYHEIISFLRMIRAMQ